MPEPSAKPGHGDHWLAALAQDDPRLADVLVPPVDAPERLTLHRTPLTQALDRVQVTHRRRLVSAYPEPRATTLVEARPRELLLWETRVEGWLVVDEPRVGALTLFLTDLAENAPKYAAASAGGPVRIEVGALAYFVNPVRRAGKNALRSARATDARFLADDYAFDAEVLQVREAGPEQVIDLSLQNGFELPLTARGAHGLQPGDRAEGYLWLTGRWAAG